MSPGMLVNSADSEALAKLAMRGDAEAFELLYREFSPGIYSMCLGMARDAHDAEQLLQDIFVRAWYQLSAFQSGNFGAWLGVLGRNVILNDRRTKHRAARWLEYGEAGQDEHPARRDVSQETRITLAGAVAALSASERTVYLMYDVRGFTTQEIAEFLGIAPATVRVHLSRARRRVGEVLLR